MSNDVQHIVWHPLPELPIRLEGMECSHSLLLTVKDNRFGLVVVVGFYIFPTSISGKWLDTCNGETISNVVAWAELPKPYGA